MTIIHDYSSVDLAGMSDVDLDHVRQQVLDERRPIHYDHAPSDRPRLLAPTDALLKRLKDEYLRRKRSF